MAESSAETLDQLAGTPRSLTVAGEVVHVAPLTFMEIVRAAKFLAPILAAVDSINAESKDIADLASLLTIAPDAMVKIASLSVHKDEAWFENLQADEGFDVLSMVYEVNKDFFVQRLLPKIRAKVPAAVLQRFSGAKDPS